MKEETTPTAGLQVGESKILAMVTALENASEFIRGHGEEGGIDDNTFDDFTKEEYLKCAAKVALQLQRKADKLLKDNGYTRA